MSNKSLRVLWTLLASVICLSVAPHDALAFISQVDGTPLPQTTRMQQCLNRAGTGETMANAVSSTADATVLPEAYRPVEDPPGSGTYNVTFLDIGEGAGYRNSFGWFYVDEDPNDTDNLHTVFNCRSYGQCDCPCATTRTVTIDFGARADFTAGRAIGFWLRSPERINGSGTDGDNCGDRTDSANRIYFTSKTLNDDGDYVHFLVYRSATRTNTYYFGFEDLFRGGDNDFEDMLVRAQGLVPLCDPQPETCDNADNDCDQAVDEGVTQGCSTACGSGVRTCTAGTFGSCSAPSPRAETCNALDDDCDSRLDEGISRACMNECGSGTEVCNAGSYANCNAPTPTIEQCDGDDDDCDGRIDENITRGCASSCGSGVETCTNGSYVGCTAPTPGSEQCNGGDDDCDGRIDENLTRACSTACGAGTETCISGNWVGCMAQTPRLEACNNEDDDCDGNIDEDLTQTCSTACGNGTEMCVAGEWVNCSAPTPGIEICNNVDDDCDNVIDDGNPGGGAVCTPDGEGGYDEVPDGGVADGGVPDGGVVCSTGRVRCVAGALQCLGASSPSVEVCNCQDDDCDGQIDENTSGNLCAGGKCLNCMCVSPCAGEEFPCPPGRVCDPSLADPENDIPGYCVPGRCGGVECTEEEVCDPLTGECENLCEDVTCTDERVCIRGRCVENNCYGRGCPVGERCRDAVCEPDPCAGVTCETGEFCREGDCVAVCSETCGADETCLDGECVDAPCGNRCATTETCVENECVANACSPPCGRGRVCEGTECIDDPCADIDCPTDYRCQGGECIPRNAGTGSKPRLGIATGSGGCACDAAGAPQGKGTVPVTGIALAMLVVGLLLRRRRGLLRALKAPLFLLVIAASAGAQGGCAVDTFCFQNCTGDGADGSTTDGSVPRRDARPVDGCIPTGDEICNDTDDDCDGLVDEGFTDTDPRNCGECNRECVVPQAFPSCVEGECGIRECEIGWHDLNDNPTDGCEYRCPPSGSEICDERDNDCDGDIDEGFDLSDDLANCGECGNLCTFSNATADCNASTCAMGDCNSGFVDLNDDPEDGCEYACTASGTEMCDSVDNDCDGNIDEGFDLETDEDNCGACGNECGFLNATAACVDGSCTLDDCNTGYYDVDRNPVTGCEYACTPTGGTDVCNSVPGTPRDEDCDGRIDESDPAVGQPCGSAVAPCTQGIRSCLAGQLVCVGGRGPTPETCNNIDDDCDTRNDESVAASPIPGVGARCGETNLGACEYGMVVCTAGALRCGGTYVPRGSETCNNIDDDCDGTADDSPSPPGSTPASCAENRGVCAGRTAICMGASGWQCSQPANFQSTETICDTLDNDCDGTPDENCLTAAPAADVRVDAGDGSGATNSVQPVINGDGDDILYAAWMDLRGGGRSHVLFSRSINDGNAWSAVSQMDTSTGAAIGPRFSVTGSSGDDVTLAWADFRGGTSFRRIYSRASTDSGATWAASDQRLNNGQDTDSFNVEVAWSGNRVYAVYERFVTPRERHVYLVSSADGGAMWGTPVQVDHGTGTTFVAATPKVAAVGTNAYVVWRDNRSGSPDIYFNRTTNGGTSVGGTDTRLDVGTTAGSSTSITPVIAAEGTNVYVAWVDNRSGSSFDVWVNRSRDSGATWLTSDPLLIDDDPIAHDSIEPRIVTTGAGRAVIAWIDYRYGFPDILASRTTNAGGTFSTPARLDTGTAAGVAGSFDIALDARGNLVGVAWADDRDGLLDIYANFSLDGGATWQPQDYRLDTTAMPGTSDSERPAVFVSDDAVHVLWVDHRGGANGDIYYRRLD